MTEAISSLIEYIEIATLPSVARHDRRASGGDMLRKPAGSEARSRNAKNQSLGSEFIL
jgi:hypothetical protein